MKQIAIALDQLLNALCGGYADETLSARVYRRRDASPWWQGCYRIINGIFFWQDDHCRDAWISELLRNQLPKSYRHA